MKKIQKTKLLTIGGGLLASTALVPAAIVYQNTKNSSELENAFSNSRILNEITSEYNLSNGRAEIATQTASGDAFSHTGFYAQTLSAYKSVPTGYVFQTKDGKIVCVDKNNPNIVLWHDVLEKNTKVISMEYLPILDTLVVLYGNSSFVKVANYSKISNHNSSEKLTAQVKIVADSDLTYKDNGTGQTIDLSCLFAMTPIIEVNKGTTELIIFRKYNPGNVNTSIKSNWTFNAEKNTLIKNVDFDLTLPKNDFKNVGCGILSCGAARLSNGNLYISNFIAAGLASLGAVWTNYSLASEVISPEGKKVSYKRTDFYKESFGGYISQLFDGGDTYEKVKIVQGSISVPGIVVEKTKNGVLAFNHLCNTFTPGLYDRKKPQLKTFMLIDTLPTATTPKSPFVRGIFGELYGVGLVNLINASFNNAQYLKNGALKNQTTSALYGAYDGWGEQVAFSVPEPYSWEKLMYLNPKLDNNFHSTNPSIALMPVAANAEYKTATNSYPLVGKFTGNYTGENQQDAMVVMNEYDDTMIHEATDKYQQYLGTKPSTYLNNLLLLANNSKEVVVVNQKNRGIFDNSTAKYDWHTRFTNPLNIFNFGADLDIDSVTKQSLITMFNLETYWYNSTLIKQLLPVGLRKDAVFTLENVQKNRSKGWLTFDLYCTIIYDQDGTLQYTNLANLKKTYNATTQSYNLTHKIGSVTITGFKSSINDKSTFFANTALNTYVNTFASQIVDQKNELIKIIKELDLIKFTNGELDYLNDVEIVSATSNDVLGHMNLVLNIKNSKGLKNGVVQDNLTLKGTLIGFKATNETELKSPEFVFPELSGYIPSTYIGEVSDTQKLVDLVKKNANSIFVNLPNQSKWSGEVTIKSYVPLDATNSARLTFWITKFYDKDGFLDIENKKEFTLILKGFGQSISTYLPSTLKLKSFDSIYPSIAKDSKLNDIKLQIIENLKNADASITIKDIDLKIVKANDNLGTLSVNIVINNKKAQLDGKFVEIYTFNNKTFTLEGFKKLESENEKVEVTSSQQRYWLPLTMFILAGIILVSIVAIVIKTFLN